MAKVCALGVLSSFYYYYHYQCTDDAEYAHKCREKAEELYIYATGHLGSANSDSGIYKNPVYMDEMVWAMVWLYRATKKDLYKETAIVSYRKHHIGWQTYKIFGWKSKNAGVGVLLSGMVNDRLSARVKKHVKKFMNKWVNSMRRTPKGLAYAMDWGPLRASAGTAFIGLLIADRISRTMTYRQFATQQIHYMLGDTGRSYVVGYGNNPPTRPHHRDSSCPAEGSCNWSNYGSPNPNPITLTGALVGGPDMRDYFDDERANIHKNEVALDYNAAFQSAVAGLKHLEMEGKLPLTY
ncbi:endoglucanase A-like [Saccoglossus kowalevskii]